MIPAAGRESSEFMPQWAEAVLGTSIELIYSIGYGTWKWGHCNLSLTFFPFHHMHKQPTALGRMWRI